MKSPARPGGLKWLALFSTIGLLSLPLSAFGAPVKTPDDASDVLKRQANPTLQSWKAQTPDISNGTDTAFPRYDWWQSFHDGALTQAIENALDGNPGLKGMASQIAAADASRKIARAPLMPSLSFDPLYTREKLGKDQFIFPIQGRNYQVFQVPLDASYELDLFGKNLAMYRSAREQLKVAQYQYEAARIQLSGMVATAYINIAKWRYLETIAHQELVSSDKLLNHSRALMDLGQATIFDIQNSQQRRDLAQVNVTQFENNRIVVENQLLSLQGLSPSSHAAPTVSLLADLNLPGQLDIGVPSQLVLHRPDVSIAEAQLNAARFDVQAARRAMLPHLTLTGSMGFNAVGVKNLFNWTSLSSFVTAAMAQPIFAGGRLRAQVKLQKADYQQMLYNYENTLLGAFTDTENSLSTLHADQVVFRDVTSQTENARQKAARQQRMVTAGLEGEPVFLAEDVQRIEYEKQLAQQKAQVLIDVVSVAKALGGGF